jgi:hypothetical protein
MPEQGSGSAPVLGNWMRRQEKTQGRLSLSLFAVLTQAANRLTGPRLTGRAMVAVRIKLGKIKP